MDHINNLETFRQEQLRCFNFTGNNYTATPNSFTNLEQW